ncbi:hypothetical protein G5714_021370 [Onychostoma macrolepis]|uniref:Ig-like domain-containing protein n=1 Tax=Onychostoma macrolepis TaxID=369639 RepID=A0A7J6BUN2_9TELE|nr:hypothetical protein G5714_021370 [Onychostoma macrolepis]
MHGFSSIMKFIIFFVYVPFVYSAITWLRNGEEHHENVDLGELIPNEDETFQKTAILHVAPDEWKKNQYVPVVVHQGNTIQKILTEIESKSKIKSNEKLHTFSTFYIEIYGQTIAGIPEFSAVTTLDGRQIDYYDSEIKKLIPRQDWMKEFVSGDRFKEYTEIREQVQQTNKINITVLMDQFSHSHGVHTYQRMYGCDWDDETGDSQGFDQHGYDGEDFISLDVEELRYISAVLQGKSSSSPVECHATGFYPSAVTITWLRNGQDYDEDVDPGETLPNEDGTFQRTSTIYVTDEWKKNQYVCVVEHMTGKILTENEIKSNNKLHTFTTFYTGINGQTIAGIPEFSAVTTLDGEQIDYYDSEIKKLIPRQDWMKEFTSTDRWKEYTEIREQVQQTNKINITVLMERFNHSYGVHTYQRMYGCGWDDKTNISHGFDQHAYDGEDFISLDVKYSMYTASVWQGVRTMMKWNSDSEQLELLKQYYQHECVDWLKYFLTLRKADSERRAPEVSLLQKDFSSPVVCHATGFDPAGVTITWLRNGQDHDEDVDFGETLPNMDGTFQRTSTLTVFPDDWKSNQYVCVVEHMTGTIRKILREDEIKSNNSKFLIVSLSKGKAGKIQTFLKTFFQSSSKTLYISPIMNLQDVGQQMIASMLV